MTLNHRWCFMWCSKACVGPLFTGLISMHCLKTAGVIKVEKCFRYGCGCAKECKMTSHYWNKCLLCPACACFCSCKITCRKCLKCFFGSFLNKTDWIVFREAGQYVYCISQNVPGILYQQHTVILEKSVVIAELFTGIIKSADVIQEFSNMCIIALWGETFSCLSPFDHYLTRSIGSASRLWFLHKPFYLYDVDAWERDDSLH